MKTHAAHCNRVKRESLSVAVLVLTVALLAGSCATASARQLIGKDGMIHACYRVKGKPKGAIRVIRDGKRRHCLSGERKVAWRVAGPATQTGGTGPQGQPGGDAAVGPLSERIDALSARVEKLEGIVQSLCSQLSIVTSLLPLEPFSCQLP